MKAKEEAADQAQPLISDTTDSVIKGSDQSPADEVERVARALAEADGIRVWDNLNAEGFYGSPRFVNKDYWFTQARAAIEALSAIRNTPQAIEATPCSDGESEK